MINLEIESEIQKVEIQIFPAKISHSGCIESKFVTQDYKDTDTEIKLLGKETNFKTDQLKTTHFRGRRLIGKPIYFNNNFNGYVFEKSTTSLWRANLHFDSLLEWEQDKPPTFFQSINEWIEISEIVNNYVKFLVT